MDSNLQSSPSESGGAKPAFHKPSNDAAHRKYRRRSPAGRSPSPDDGPIRDRSSSPIKRQDTAKVSDDRGRKDYDEKDLDRHHHSRSYRQSSRSSSHNDDVIRHADKDERSKSSSRSRGREIDHDWSRRREIDHDRSRGREIDHDRSKKYKSESSSYRSRDYKERENSSVDFGSRKSEGAPYYGEGKSHTISPPKKPKLFTDRPTERVSKFTNKVEETPQSSSGFHDFSGKANSEKDNVKDSDVDAAKIAAIRAAELVNKNLTGTGMSTDQKKKLLWGSKKASTTTEEPAHRWDASVSLFPDQERQEKFKKLMGVKGDVKVENNGVLQVEEKHKELQIDLEKQYTAGLRRRDGRTVGLGL